MTESILLRGVWRPISYKIGGISPSGQNLSDMPYLVLLPVLVNQGMTNGMWGAISYLQIPSFEVALRSTEALTQFAREGNCLDEVGFHVFSGGQFTCWDSPESCYRNIDFSCFIGESPSVDELEMVTSRGVYLQEGRVLSLCKASSTSSDRPKDLDSSKNSIYSLTVYELAHSVP